MPYIKDDRRKAIVDEYEGQINIDVNEIMTAGEMQYAMAVMFKSYIDRLGLQYQNLNDVMGAITGAQQEFYRIMVAPYEDKKIRLNGGVYTYDRR